MKPICVLSETDGNVFALAAQVRRALRKAGLKDQEQEFTTKLRACKDYTEALNLMMDYVEVE